MKVLLLCSSPLFLAVRHGIEYKNNVIWYHAKLLGVTSIGQFMSKALTLLNSYVSGKIANHSCMKRSITNMLNLFLTQISGHKKVDKSHNYNIASLKTQKKILAVLNDGASRPSASYSSSTSVSSTILTESEEFEMMKEWDMQLPPPMPSYPKIHSSASMFVMFYGASNINVQIIQNAPSPVND